MVVADDEVDAVLRGIGHLFQGLDTAVERDDEFHPCLAGIVDTLVGDTIAFTFAVRDVEINIVVQLLKVGVDQRDGRRTIDVVVAIDHDALPCSYRLIDAVYRLSHTFHNERVVNLIQPRAEKTPCLFKGRNTPLYQQGSNDSVNTKRCSKIFNSL